MEAFATSALVALGFPVQGAAICAVRMIEADLRGVDTHGIFRLPHYSQRIRVNGINLRPTVRTVRENDDRRLAILDGLASDGAQSGLDSVHQLGHGESAQQNSALVGTPIRSTVGRRRRLFGVDLGALPEDRTA